MKGLHNSENRYRDPAAAIFLNNLSRIVSHTVYQWLNVGVRDSYQQCMDSFFSLHVEIWAKCIFLVNVSFPVFIRLDIKVYSNIEQTFP